METAKNTIASHAGIWLLVIILNSLLLLPSFLSGQVSKTNNLSGIATDTIITRTVGFISGVDFPPGSLINDVNISVTWDDAGATLFSLHDETFFWLTSPSGTRVVLVYDAYNSHGRGPAIPSTYSGFADLTAPVTVLFDQSAATPVGGADPISGTFRPQTLTPLDNLDNFNGESPFGIWTLTIGDVSAGVGTSGLGFNSFTLSISASGICTSDTINPTITCPPNITANNEPGFCGASLCYDPPNATDNCSGIRTDSIPGYSLAGTLNGHSYYLSDNNLNWEDAANAATAIGGHLVTITSAAEDSFVSAIFPGHFWIGATDSASEGDWRWVTGDTICFDNWCTGTIPEPSAGTGEHFAHHNFDNPPFCIGPGWNDAPNSPTILYRYVVEFDLLPQLDSGIASGGFFPVGVNPVTYTATDSAGNQESCTFTVTVVDVEPPDITCPPSQTLYVSPTSCEAIMTYPPPIATDNCAGVSITRISGAGIGDTITLGGFFSTGFIATDSAGNTDGCSFITIVQDSTPPQISCHPDTVLSTDPQSCDRLYSWGPLAIFDNCGAFPLSQSHPDTTIFALGTTVVTLIAADPRFNQDTCTFSITVEDQVPPVESCPPNITVPNLQGFCGATVNYIPPTGTDNCSSPTTVLSSGMGPGAFFSVGVHTETYTVTDSSGNASSCSMTITVEDVESPVITGCPTSQVQPQDAGQCAAEVNWSSPSASDNCGVTSFSSSTATGSSFPVGATLVTYTALDAANNMDTCSFTVVVYDTTPPVLAMPSNITTNADTGTCGALVTFPTPTATDECGGGIIIQLYGPPSGFFFPVGITPVTFMATDSAGNTSSGSFTITVMDHAPPKITCPASLTVQADSFECETYTPVSKPGKGDDCGASTLRASNTNACDASGYFGIGVSPVTFTATDESGNSDSCTFTVTVLPETLNVSASSPTFSCGYHVSCNGATDGTATATVTNGPCGPYTYLWSDGQTDSVATGLAAGQYYVDVFTAYGDSARAFVTLTEPAPLVVDSIDVSFLGASTNLACNGDTNGYATVFGNGGCAPYTYLWSDGQTTPAASNLNAGTYTFTQTDQNGCTVVDTLTLTEPPAFTVNLGPNQVACHGQPISVTANTNASAPRYRWNTGDTTQTIFITAAGPYWCQVTDGFGCSETDSIDITKTITAANFGVDSTNGRTVYFRDLSSVNIVSWSWDFGDGSGTSAMQNPSYTYGSDGTFPVCLTVTGADGCDSTFCDSVSVALTGLEDELAENGIRVYPNPNNGVFWVEFSGYEGETAKIELIDQFGRSVLKKSIFVISRTFKAKMYIGEFSKSIYLLKIEVGENLAWFEILNW